MTKKLAFSYIRMSTEAQLQGHSLERQLALTRAYAEEKDFQLVEDLCDIGLSAHDGSNVEKGKLGQFLNAVKSGKIDKNCVLLVESLDRLSRKTPRQAFQQLNEFLDYGIEVHTIFDRQVYTQESMDTNAGQLFMSIGFMLRSHSESEEKSRRLKKRWQSNREHIRDRILTSRCPAWLEAKSDRTGFNLLPGPAATVQKIFELSIEDGMGIYAIARYLNQYPEKYPHFTEPEKRNRVEGGRRKTGWHKSYILKILNNPAVYGEFTPHETIGKQRVVSGETLHDYFPAVISKDCFLLSQARLQQRKIKGGGRKGETFQNVFTKLLTCGGCGGTINFYNKGAGSKGGKYLRCGNAVTKHGCECRAWRYEEFEEAFFNYVSDVNFGAALQKGNDRSRKDVLLHDLDIIQQRIKNFSGQIDSLLDLQPSMSKAALRPIAERLEKLSIEIASLEDKKKEIELELVDINGRNSFDAHSEIIQAIKQAQTEAADQDRLVIRRMIHNQIAAVIKAITLDGLNSDDKDIQSFTAVFKNGHEQTVFPYASEDDTFGAELRTIGPDATPAIKIDTRSFKFLGRIPVEATKPAKRIKK